MKKVFISVLMKNKTEKEIMYSFEKMKKLAKAYLGDDIELIDSFITEQPPKDVNDSMWYMSKSIEKLSEADYIISIESDIRPFKDITGCDIEKFIFAHYGDKENIIEIPKKYLETNEDEETIKVEL